MESFAGITRVKMLFTHDTEKHLSEVRHSIFHAIISKKKWAKGKSEYIWYLHVHKTSLEEYTGN